VSTATHFEATSNQYAVSHKFKLYGNKKKYVDPKYDEIVAAIGADLFAAVKQHAKQVRVPVPGAKKSGVKTKQKATAAAYVYVRVRSCRSLFKS